MAGWATPQYRKAEVNAAGKTLIDPAASPDQYERAIEIINNWRASHGFPLNTFQVTLRNRAKRVEAGPLIAQRLKRLPAIGAKLRRFGTMNLAEMQDIGGCRAVVENVPQAAKLVDIYKSSKTKHKFLREKDYVGKPKSDGYRSFHLIYRYHSDAKDQEPWNGLQIEIQIRSKLQHAWATAVETVDFFTGQALKSSIGEEQWKRFFQLMGGALALMEGTTPVAGIPRDQKELTKELKEAARQLKVIRTLQAWGKAIQILRDYRGDMSYFLLSLDPDAKRISIRGFVEGDSKIASEQYVAAERQIRDEQRGGQAVLVGVDSIPALRLAYPSFFVDTRLFIRALERAMKL